MSNTFVFGIVGVSKENGLYTLFGVPRISEDQIGVPQIVIFILAGSFSFVVCSNSLDDYPNTWMEKFV